MKPASGMFIAVLGLALTLGGCSSRAKPPAASAVGGTRWIAVARGQVDVAGGMVLVTARTSGIVTRIGALQGDAVKAGQGLAQLDARAAKLEVATAKSGLAQARAQVAELKVSMQQARQHASRVAAAAKLGAATGEAADQARDQVASLAAKLAAASAAQDAARQKLATAQLDLEATRLTAPVAGTVVERHLAVGQAVSAASGQALFKLLPDRPHVIHAQVDAEAAVHLHPGMHAEVIRDSGGGPAYHATLTWVGQVLTPASLTRDPLARALATDVDCRLKLAPAKAGQPPLHIGQRVLVKFPRQ